MADYRECMTEACTTDVEATPGNYYCASCVCEQMRAQRLERQAFEDYHAYADECARRSV